MNPDGYYFTPPPHLFIDVYEFYRHVDRQSNKVNNIIFPESQPGEWKALDRGPDKQWETLYYAMEICNDFQRIKTTEMAVFTIDDMKIVSKAAESLRVIAQSEGIVLVWA